MSVTGEKMSLSEAQWNFMVHHKLLELVVKKPKYKGTIGCMNM